jgi:hypothetical protein
MLIFYVMFAALLMVRTIPYVADYYTMLARR